ncbi:MAG: LptA/OstA family protein [Armatimonadota bacterium]|nr:LptA/OstA family protein [Armatimonadota bacterium]
MRTGGWRRIVAGLTAAILLVLSTVAPGALAAASPASGRRLEISADEMAVDASARTARAAGRVRISDGQTVATADRATLYHREGRGVLSGNARVVGSQGDLEAEQITILYTTTTITRITARGSASLDTEGVVTSAQVITLDPATSTMRAERGVTAFTKPDVVATGARLTYQRAQGRIVLEGAARVQNRDGFLAADRIEGLRRWDRVTATDNVHGRFRDIEVRSRAAEIFNADKRAVFTGDVTLTQPGRRLVTERVTVWYEAGRVVAEGQTTMRLEPQP